MALSGSGPISSLFVEFRASTSKWSEDMRAIGKEARELEKVLKPTIDRAKEIGIAFTAVGGAVLASIGAMVKSSIDLGDKLKDMSVQTGASVEQLSRLGFAAEQNGASLEDVGTAMRKVSLSALEAANNIKGKQAEAFSALGIEVQAANGQIKDANTLLFEMSDAFEKTQDGPEKVATAVALLGKNGAALIPVLNSGSAELKRMGDELESVGAVMSTKAAIAADEFNDAINLNNKAIQGFSNAVAAALVPALTDLVRQLTPVIAKFGEWARMYPEVVRLTALLAAELTGAGGLIIGLTAVAALLPKINAGLSLLAKNPIIAAIAAFVALATAAFVYRHELELGINAIKQYIASALIPLIDIAAKVARAFEGVIELIPGIADSAPLSGLHGRLTALSLELEEMAENARVANIALRFEQLDLNPHIEGIDDLNKGVINFGDNTKEAAEKAAEALKKLKQDSINDLIEGFSQMDMENRAATLTTLRSVKIGVDMGPLPKAPEDLKIWSENMLAAWDRIGKSGSLPLLLQSIERIKETMGQIEMPPMLAEMTTRAELAMKKARDQANDLGASIKELTGLGYDEVQIMAMLAGEFSTAARNVEQYGVKVDETTDRILAQIDATKKAAAEAQRWQQTWSQVMANIVTDFARGITDVIFRARSFTGALADIGKQAGRAFTQAFFAELFSPLTQMLAGWGRQLAGMLQTQVIPKITGAIGLGSIASKTGGAVPPVVPGVPGAQGGFFGLSGAKLLAFAKDPITLAVAAVVGGIFAATKLIGRGREQADKFGDQIERPFALQIGQIVDGFNSAKAAGALSLQEAKATRDELVQLQRTFNSQASAFAAEGDQQRKVVEQAIAGHNANFGPNLTRVLDQVNAEIAALSKGGGVNGSGIPATGLALSASNVIDGAADKFVLAVDRLVAHGGTGGSVINAPFNPTVNVSIDGATADVRRELMAQIDEILNTGLDGWREKWTAYFRDNKGLVTA